ETQFFVGQRLVEAVASETPFVLAAVLKDDLPAVVELDDRVLVPAGTGTGHRVLGAEFAPCQVEALLVAVDVLEREVAVLGVPQSQPQFAVAAAFVDQVLAALKRPLMLGDFR